MLSCSLLSEAVLGVGFRGSSDCCAGGYMIVNIGFVEFLTGRDELAAVLASALAHSCPRLSAFTCRCTGGAGRRRMWIASEHSSRG